jgi:flavin-dependent dehydrogenase
VYDVIVLGGGPAGSTAAARLAELGRSVLVVERERFPRFHIGESLLPCSTPLLAKLGALPEIERAGFVRKYAAEFVTGDGAIARRYPFADGLVPGAEQTFQVDRDRFDELLLEYAARSGAGVEQGSEASAVEVDARGVSVQVLGPDGNERSVRARVLVDATGQRSLVARRFGLRELDPDLKNFSLYSHYEGAARASGEAEGDVTIVRVPHGWWWVIPLSSDRTSVGWVAPKRALGGRAPGEALFLERLEQTPYLNRRFAGARRVAPVRGASDFCYRSRRFAGERWLLAGDAAAFIDPVFSSGVYLAMVSGYRAAAAIDAALARRTLGSRPFRAYERWFGRLIDVYSTLAKNFYTPEFGDVLMNPTDRLKLRRAAISLLAGHGVGHFNVTWRLWIFYAVVRLNRRLRLVPRLSARPTDGAA